MILMTVLAASMAASTPAGDALDAAFRAPPESARAETWWHWMNGEVTEEGITADLEAAREMGLGAVQLFNAGGGKELNIVPRERRVLCMTPEWDALVTHAMRECTRLGLGFYVQNCAGWSGAGGPWITPSNTMFHIEVKTADVAAGASATLAAPPTWPTAGSTFYRDIRTYAFPVPPHMCEPPLPTPTLSDPTCTTLLRDAKDAAPRLYVPKSQQTPSLERDLKTGDAFAVTYDYGRPVTVRACEIAQDASPSIALTVEADGKYVVTIPHDSAVWFYAGHNIAYALPATTARRFRLVWRATAPARLSVRRAVFASRPVLTAARAQMGYESRSIAGGFADVPDEPGEAVALADIHDLTPLVATDGTLRWTAPNDGRLWRMVRIGYRGKTRNVMPAAPGGSGLECDKFDAATVAFHYTNFVGRIRNLARSAGVAQCFRGCLVDSYEADTQTWTPRFPEEFARRRGYDLFPHLLAYADVIVGDRATTRRFLRDMRQTFSDLIAENFYGTLHRCAQADGLTLAAETCAGGAAGTAVGDGLQHHFETDYPMTESNGNGAGKKMAVSAADSAGLPIVAMEAHTSRIDWGEHPAMLFAAESGFFADGINRIVFHTTGHNPSPDRNFPGVCFNSYGCSPSRGQTWRVHARGWLDAVARIQAVMRRGVPVVDLAVTYGEEAMGPNIGMKGQGDGEPLAGLDGRVRAGYDWDMLSPQRFTRHMRMKDGRFGEPNGVQYALLVMRNCTTMTPDMAEKITAWAKAGLAVLMETEPTAAPGLTDRVASDRRVAAAMRELRTLKTGRVMRGMSIADALRAIGLAPDWGAANGDRRIRARHRKDGAMDIWYVMAEDADCDRVTRCRFRAGGNRTPEVFDPVTGEVYVPDNVARTADGTVTADLRLSRSQPLLVVFREKPAARPHRMAHAPNVLAGPWHVSFAGQRAPAARTTTLANLSASQEDDARYFSGLITYRAAFDLKEPAAFDELDLGTVGVSADVTLNGTPVGIAWTPPYRLAHVGRALKAGRNEIVIRVANTWYNRLCGDAKLPAAERVTWASDSTITAESTLDGRVSGLVGPVALR